MPSRRRSKRQQLLQQPWSSVGRPFCSLRVSSSALSLHGLPTAPLPLLGAQTAPPYTNPSEFINRHRSVVQSGKERTEPRMQKPRHWSRRQFTLIDTQCLCACVRVCISGVSVCRCLCVCVGVCVSASVSVVGVRVGVCVIYRRMIPCLFLIPIRI